MSSNRKVIGLRIAGALCAGIVALSAVGCGGDDPPPAAGEGVTYILNVPADNWSPAAVGAEVGAYVPPFLIKVDSLGELIIGTSNMAGTAQQMCNPTARVPATGATVPELAAGPADVPIYVVNAGTADAPIDPSIKVLSTAYGFTIASVLPDGSGDATGTLAVTMDVREIYPLFTQIIGVNPDAVCGALDSLTVPCQPCADGQLYCLAMTANFLEATEFAGDLVEVPAADPACF